MTSIKKQPLDGGLLPYLCSATSILGLVLAGELLALAIALIETSLAQFSWVKLGSVSMVVQWIVLISALVLCRLAPLLNRLPLLVGGCLAYLSVLFVALIVIGGAQWLMLSQFNFWGLAKNMILAAVFSGIFLRYLYLQQQLHNQQRAELQARIQALHARIRPHFLFNSMNAIASLIPVNPVLAEKVVEDLSRLFRISLQENSLVTLQEELSLCRSYIDIEQVRLGERLQVDWQCDDYPKKTKIPSLALQPLIENAIYHGIQKLPKGGEIIINTHSLLNKTQQQVLIRVVNPMPKVDTHKETDSLPNLKNNHIALKNIEHRLQAHYGSNASIEAEVSPEENAEGVTTENYTVTLRIPIDSES